MAFDAQVHESFIEFPTGVSIPVAPGTLWSGSTTLSPRVEANANFASGKALLSSVTRQLLAVRSFPASFYTGVPSQLVQFNTIRTADAALDNTDANRGIGWYFQTGVANYAWRISWGSSAVGLQNTLYLQYFAGSATMVLAFQTENIYQLGVKYDMGLRIFPTTGQVQWWINNELVFDSTLGAMAGRAIIGMGVGRLGNVSDTVGEFYTGDLYTYTDSSYLGPVEIMSGVPTADDTLQDWTFTGPTAWQSVNNTLAATPADYIEGAASGDISDFDSAVDNTSVYQVYSVCAAAYMTRTDVLPIQVEIRLGQGVAFNNGSSNTPPQSTYERFEDVYLTNPNTAASWVPADLSALLIGVEYV